MLKNTRPFIISGATGKNATIVHDNLNLETVDLININTVLELSPGDPSVTYPAPEPVLEQFSFNARSLNNLIVGVSVKASAFINSAQSIYSLTSEYNNGYDITAIEGETLSILIGVVCEEVLQLDPTYNLEQLIVTGATPKTHQVSGAISPYMSAGAYKSWRLTFDPQDLISDMVIGFSSAGGDPSQFKKISFRSIDGQIIKTTTHDNPSYNSGNIFNLRLTKMPNKYTYIWQSRLADLTYKTVTTGTPSVSQISLGPVSVGGSLVSTFVFRALEPINITEINASITTLQIGMLKIGATRDQVAGDFTVQVIAQATTFTFTGISLSQVLPVNISLNKLDVIELQIIYAPKLKVIPNASMLNPYNATTASSIAVAINNNRQLKVTLKSGNTVVGDPLVIKGSIV